ncbi:MAG: ATP-dependent helicase HrpB [Pseudomonadota bacterium]
MTNTIPPLPVMDAVGDVRRALAERGRAVLQAPPGAGKTTGIPPALLDEPWLAGRRIIVLAPRRLAARAAAARMAHMMGESVGATVGYRVRMDTKVSAATRIEVVTEGVLTRRLQHDPALEGVGLVVFDEFHERSLDADLGLALCLDIQGVLNADLRLLVMSATLETAPVAALLGEAPVISCPGKAYPVETRFVGRHTPDPAMAGITEVILTAAREEDGSLLVFLPGAGEIRRVAALLDVARLGSEWIIAPLYGNLTRTQQDLAISPAPPDRRKIVLATSIAETSLTIEGIRVVVDSGLQRTARFDPGTGLTRLVTIPVSRAAADQRRGRAGRTAPGICLRLWSESMHHALPSAHRPEILEADLAGLALELALWGVADPTRLKWLDPPPQPATAAATELLRSLGALDDSGAITAHGRKMAALPAHPRLAHMMVAADAEGAAAAACHLAALLGERDVVRWDRGQADVDMAVRLSLVTAAEIRGFSGGTVDPSALKRVRQVAAQFRHHLKSREDRKPAAAIGRLLAWAYPDRIAQARPGQRGRYLLSSGRGAFLYPDDPMAAEPYLVAVELDGDRNETRIFRAAAYPKETLQAQFASAIRWKTTVAWDADRQAVSARRQAFLGALSLQSESLADPDPALVSAALMEGIRRAGIDCLPWTKRLRAWQRRVMFMHRSAPEDWPDLSDDHLTASLESWLGPVAAGMVRLKELARVDLTGALTSLVPRHLQRRLDDLVPTHFVVPSGSRIPIDYAGEAPVLAVRLQEMFGLTDTPTVAGGRVPIVIHLLSPASRPVQITRDLASFWRTGYPEVKKDLKGRYPKHHWPDDPLTAMPTARVKPRG